MRRSSVSERVYRWSAWVKADTHYPYIRPVHIRVVFTARTYGCRKNAPVHTGCRYDPYVRVVRIGLNCEWLLTVVVEESSERQCVVMTYTSDCDWAADGGDGWLVKSRVRGSVSSWRRPRDATALTSYATRCEDGTPPPAPTPLWPGDVALCPSTTTSRCRSPLPRVARDRKWRHNCSCRSLRSRCTAAAGLPIRAFSRWSFRRVRC